MTRCHFVLLLVVGLTAEAVLAQPGVVVTGNETPFVVGVSKDLTCTAVDIDVARIEWKFLYAGFDLELRSATGVNELTITPNPSVVGTQMFWCVVISTTGAIYSQDAPITIKDALSMAMSNEVDVLRFLYSWQQLSAQHKAEGLNSFATEQRQNAPYPTSKISTVSDPTKTYDNVQLYSYYSYLYYYPTMSWFLDRTPETDDYWVGIYPKGAENNEYITYQWLERTAQGSYYIGKLSTTAGKESRDRSEEFELRLFKGDYQFVDADTNILRGTIEHAPTDPDDPDYASNMAIVEGEELDPETRAVIEAVKKFEFRDNLEEGKIMSSSSLQDLREQWNVFTQSQQQLLLPVLQQEAMPDRIKKSHPKDLDRPEPKIYFPSLGKTQATSAQNVPNAPEKIVLTISLKYSYTYIYPVVNVVQSVPERRAWIGVYRTESDMNFDPNGYIDNDWQWVGPGETGSTKLNYIEEYYEGQAITKYLGVIFKGSTPDEQMGLAAQAIAAAVTTTPPAPTPDFNPDFNKSEGLLFAKLSMLAYEPYSIVQEELQSKYHLQADFQIYNRNSDTNGFIASNDHLVVVAFRGTQSWKNIFTDIWFVRKRIIPHMDALAHGGFVAAFDSVYESIANVLQGSLGKKKLFITGHSLGGALASLLVYRLTLEHSEAQPTMYVYGCPPVGDISFSTYFEGRPSNTITIENDPISSGKALLLGPWAGLYKPVHVEFLPRAAGHFMRDYIEQLESLS